jgi:uncharacterized protein YbcI
MSTNVSEHGRLAMAIGNGITRLHRERYGRGANTTRTVLQRDLVLVVLEDIYTPSERTLIDAGDWEMVKGTRQAFQMAMGPAFIDVVEGVLSRKVSAFMSQVHKEPDVASELFLLERLMDGPVDGVDGLSRVEM